MFADSIWKFFRGGPNTLLKAAGLLTEIAQLQIYEEVPDFLRFNRPY
jgi:hypothetical protein